MAHYDIFDYTGSKKDGAVNQRTRLLTDHEAGRILGFDGGWDNALKLGLAYDTRDFQPNPTRGVFLQGMGRFPFQALGARFTYQQYKLEGRGYYDFLKSNQQALVLALRAAMVTQQGDVPFYAMNIIPETDGDWRGLGGANTMRGYANNRFVGEHATWANVELRWWFKDVTLWKHHLMFGIAPFLDSGRVYDSLDQFALEDWRSTYGVGFRLAWNVATVINFDFGWSAEADSFYMKLGSQY